MTEAGSLARARSYAPYGGIMTDSGGAVDSFFQFGGKAQMARIGLSYFPYRYYSPTQARWTMRDPLGMVDGPNVYAYVGGNPINRVDQLGLSSGGEKPSWFPPPFPGPPAGPPLGGHPHGDRLTECIFLCLLGQRAQQGFWGGILDWRRLWCTRKTAGPERDQCRKKVDEDDSKKQQDIYCWYDDCEKGCMNTYGPGSPYDKLIG